MTKDSVQSTDQADVKFSRPHGYHFRYLKVYLITTVNHLVITSTIYTCIKVRLIKCKQNAKIILIRK